MKKSLLSFLVASLVMSFLPQSAQAQEFAKKKIFFIGTGGTIAGLAQNPSSPSYDPGKVTINAILDAVPDIKNEANIDGQQLVDVLKVRELMNQGLSEADALKRPEAYVNTCSCNLSEYHWRLLAQQVDRALNEEGYDAVIITHGTDTIEETAFFLEMTVHSNKPVILVGARRPSNNPQADGPQNIRDAVQVAIHPSSIGRGVMIAMNGVIYPAFSVTEVRATMPADPIVDTFQSPHFGVLGRVRGRFVFWNTRNTLNEKNIRSLKFTVGIEETLPKVPILWQYVGSDGPELVSMYRNQGVRAFVLGGYGVGSAPAELRSIVASTFAPDSGEVFVDGSRTKNVLADNVLSYDPNAYMKGLVMSGPLSPYEAKIFLQLVIKGLDEKQPMLQAIVEQLPAGATLHDKVRAIFTEFLYRRLGFPAQTN